MELVSGAGGRASGRAGRGGGPTNQLGRQPGTPVVVARVGGRHELFCGFMDFLVPFF